MASTIKIQNTLDYVRTYPSLTSVLGNPTAGYGGNAIPIRLANKVLQEVLQKPFNFKWNQAIPAPFYTNWLQSDYSTSITNLGWIESATRTDINNTQIPKPIRGVEAVRELLPTSVQGISQQISWLPNALAICGTWQASTQYQNPVGLNSMPNQPFTQIRDTNGNLQVLTTYGTTGATAPTWPTAGATPGTVTNDGTAAWTLMDPNGITFRLSPLPPMSGVVWQIQPIYQLKPTIITSVNQVWGIPDEMSYIFEQGFFAYAWDCAEDTSRFEKEYTLFQMQIQKALESSDREAENFTMFPGRSITGYQGSYTRGDEQYPPGLFGWY
jgi:hypothetical protein